MSIYRTQLPQLLEGKFITDGGLETDMIFNHQFDLPHFASYDMLREQKGYEALYAYYESYVTLAQKNKLGIVLETVTWRASSDWGEIIGDSPQALQQFNQQAVELIDHIRQEYIQSEIPIVISACIGPRGDGYQPTNLMTAEQAKSYHSEQIEVLSQTKADLISALTINYIDEAIGIVQAAREFNMPVCISFTLETDGKLPTGESLQEAIETVDAKTNSGACYYMINCAHPTHFEHIFHKHAAWQQRVKGLRCNASCLSHAELDECETLDDGNPTEFGKSLAEIQKSNPQINILGGCCGTDLRHLEQICDSITLR